MIRLAETSFWHWNQMLDKTDKNLSVGLWQLARVYTIVGHQEQALIYGNRCLVISEAAQLPAFYIGYAHEAIARAQQAAGQDYTHHLSLAYQLVSSVVDEESKEMLLADLKQID